MVQSDESKGPSNAHVNVRLGRSSQTGIPTWVLRGPGMSPNGLLLFNRPCTGSYWCVCVQTLLAFMSQMAHAPAIAARQNTGRFSTLLESYIFADSCPHKSMHSPINSASFHVNSQQCLPPLFQCHITIKGENPLYYFI